MKQQIPYFKGDAMGFSVTEGPFASLEQIKAMVLEPRFNLSGTFEESVHHLLYVTRTFYPSEQANAQATLQTCKEQQNEPNT